MLLERVLLACGAHSPCPHHALVHTQIPYTALIWFGCYSLGTISINMLTFRECPEAAAELLEEIKEARADLARKGVSVD